MITLSRANASVANADFSLPMQPLDVQASSSIRPSMLNILSGALALDKQFKASFLSSMPEDRLLAIEHHNKSYAQHYGQHLIRLNNQEAQLVMNMKITSLLQFYQALAEVITQIQQSINLPISNNGGRRSELYFYGLGDDNSAA